MKIEECKSKIVHWDKNFGLLIPEKMLKAAGFLLVDDLLITLEQDPTGKTRLIVTVPDEALIHLPIKENQHYQRGSDDKY